MEPFTNLINPFTSEIVNVKCLIKETVPTVGKIKTFEIWWQQYVRKVGTAQNTIKVSDRNKKLQGQIGKLGFFQGCSRAKVVLQHLSVFGTWRRLHVPRSIQNTPSRFTCNSIYMITPWEITKTIKWHRHINPSVVRRGRTLRDQFVKA